MSPELAIIIPTYNLADNIATLVEKLDAALFDIEWEVIFVDDDSTDITLDELNRLSRTDRRIRYLHRIGRRGFASAIVEGMLATNTPFLGVIDVDQPHDEAQLRAMLKMLQAQECDIVVGSSGAVENGLTGGLKHSHWMSIAANRLAQLALPVQISDPLCGFFMMTRAAFMKSVRNLSSYGRILLLDIILSSPGRLRIKEITYISRTPELKGDQRSSDPIHDCLLLLIDKATNHLIPARFIFFGAVGGSGVLIHMATLFLSLKLEIPFTVSQSIAVFVAMTYNFFGNNILTYRDKQLKGFWPIIKGLVSFYMVCGAGAVSNVGVASILFARNYSWWLSAVAGILMAVVWNYALSATFTWRK